MRAALPYLPWALTLLRAALAPVMLALALWAPLPAGFVTCILLAFVSDLFDGIVARRLGVATPALRRADSVADSLFYIAATFAVWHVHPAAIREHAALLLTLLGLELARYALDLYKFRREAAYHMWSSKLWGIGLCIGFIGVLGAGDTGWPVWLAAAPGIVADIEGLLISCVLPQWRNDVPSLWHAVALRQQLLQARNPS